MRGIIFGNHVHKRDGLKSLRAIYILGTEFPKWLTLVRESDSTRNKEDAKSDYTKCQGTKCQADKHTSF